MIHEIRNTYLKDFGNNLKLVGFANLFVLLLLGILAYIISIIDPAFDALFLALIFGIFFGIIYTDERKKLVVERSLKFLLPIGITFYGVNINFPYLSYLPIKVVILTLFFASLMGIIILLLARKFGVSKNLALLLACGTSICGVSAIAILSPLVNPKKDEFSAAIIIITVVGLTGAMLYPMIGYLLSLPPDTYALLSGATLHQTGLVKIASKPFGSKVVMEALAIKGVRIAMIALVALIVSIIYSEYKFYVPWYIGSFLIVALFSSLYLPNIVVSVLRPISTIAFSITLASIGFTVNVKQIQRVRLTPLILSYIGWFCSVFIFVLVGGKL